jgi:hypothetical protein
VSEAQAKRDTTLVTTPRASPQNFTCGPPELFRRIIIGVYVPGDRLPHGTEWPALRIDAAALVVKHDEAS